MGLVAWNKDDDDDDDNLKHADQLNTDGLTCKPFV